MQFARSLDPHQSRLGVKHGSVALSTTQELEHASLRRVFSTLAKVIGRDIGFAETVILTEERSFSKWIRNELCEPEDRFGHLACNFGDSSPKVNESAQLTQVLTRRLDASAPTERTGCLTGHGVGCPTHQVGPRCDAGCEIGGICLTTVHRPSAS